MFIFMTNWSDAGPLPKKLFSQIYNWERTLCENSPKTEAFIRNASLMTLFSLPRKTRVFQIRILLAWLCEQTWNWSNDLIWSYGRKCFVSPFHYLSNWKFLFAIILKCSVFWHCRKQPVLHLQEFECLLVLCSRFQCFLPNILHQALLVRLTSEYDACSDSFKVGTDGHVTRRELQGKGR